MGDAVARIVSLEGLTALSSSLTRGRLTPGTPLPSWHGSTPKEVRGLFSTIIPAASVSIFGWHAQGDCLRVSYDARALWHSRWSVESLGVDLGVLLVPLTIREQELQNCTSTTNWSLLKPLVEYVCQQTIQPGWAQGYETLATSVVGSRVCRFIMWRFHYDLSGSQRNFVLKVSGLLNAYLFIPFFYLVNLFKFGGHCLLIALEIKFDCHFSNSCIVVVFVSFPHPCTADSSTTPPWKK